MATQLRTITLEDSSDWSFKFGRRYLDVKSFIDLCHAVGLNGCFESELEEYEREKWMFPAARIVLPERFAIPYYEASFAHAGKYEVDDDLLPLADLWQALKIHIPLPNEPADFDLRHLIDQKLGLVPGLFQPSQEEYVPWKSFSVNVRSGGQSFQQSTVTHYYHYWQIYQLYEVRRYRKDMYQDRAVSIRPPTGTMTGSVESLAPFFDAVSRYHHLYSAKEYRIQRSVQPDTEGVTYLSQVQVNELEQAARTYARDVLQEAGFTEDQVYDYLRGLMHLHHNYEQSERVRLAESLRLDIWVQFSLFTTPMEHRWKMSPCVQER